jgi:hypothetical protein
VRDTPHSGSSGIVPVLRLASQVRDLGAINDAGKARALLAAMRITVTVHLIAACSEISALPT